MPQKQVKRLKFHKDKDYKQKITVTRYRRFISVFVVHKSERRITVVTEYKFVNVSR